MRGGPQRMAGFLASHFPAVSPVASDSDLSGSVCASITGAGYEEPWARLALRRLIKVHLGRARKGARGGGR